MDPTPKQERTIVFIIMTCFLLFISLFLYSDNKQWREVCNSLSYGAEHGYSVMIEDILIDAKTLSPAIIDEDYRIQQIDTENRIIYLHKIF